MTQIHLKFELKFGDEPFEAFFLSFFSFFFFFKHCKIVWKIFKLNPFQLSVAYRIETSDLICFVNQMIGFYMMGSIDRSWVNWIMASFTGVESNFYTCYQIIYSYTVASWSALTWNQSFPSFCFFISNIWNFATK